jgi:CHAD domain-containing protein
MMAVGSDPIEGSATEMRQADPAELVHEARKTIKRMRALARLLRHQLGEPEFGRVNDSLRITAQRLAGARDAEVRLATLHALAKRHPKALAPARIRPLSERLESERGEVIEPSDRDQVLADIATMRIELAHWKIIERDFEALAPGLRRIYREGRQRAQLVKRGHARDAQDLHDWRKRVKSLYYVLDMLGGSDSIGARGATRRADRLGDLLGDEHDLWMLRAYLEQHPNVFEGDNATRDALLKRIERRRKRLRERALELGARLYRRKPSSFTRHMGRSLAA